MSGQGPPPFIEKKLSPHELELDHEKKERSLKKRKLELEKEELQIERRELFLKRRRLDLEEEDLDMAKRELHIAEVKKIRNSANSDEVNFISVKQTRNPAKFESLKKDRRSPINSPVDTSKSEDREHRRESGAGLGHAWTESLGGKEGSGSGRQRSPNAHGFGGRSRKL